MKRLITLVILSLIPFVVFAQRTRGTANAHLQGRNIVGSLPKPSSDAHLEGTVVVQVKVDQYGNVTEAVPGVSGTTVTDKGLWNAARSAAMKAHFNTKADAPVIQTGTITYEYSSSDDNTEMTEGASVKSWHLDGRNASHLPLPAYQCNGAGEVTIIITVNNQGTVVDAKIDESVSSQDGCLRSFATRAARLSKFNASSSAPSRQMGTITYSFKPEYSASQSLESISEVIDESAIRFLGVPIDGSRQYMLNRLKAIGFIDSNRNFLEGQFNGEPVRVYVHTYHDKVDRIIVVFDTVPEMNLREQYNNLLALFQSSKKYKPIQISRAIPKDDFFYWTNKEYKSRFSVVSDSGKEINGEVWFAIIDQGGHRVGLYYDNLNNRPHGEDL